MRHFHRRNWVRPLVIVFSLFCSAGVATATSVIMPSDDEMIIGARAIVRAKVLSVGSALDERHDRIYTYITLRVQEVYKGQIAERKIVLRQEGGQVGERGSLVFGSPQFAPGERVLLYLETWPDGAFRAHQYFLGKFNIERDPQTGRQVVARSAPDENTTVLQSANKTVTKKMELSAYIQMVRSRLAANLERAQIFEETHYRNAPMLAHPPEYGEKASKGGIQPHFTLIRNPPPRWFEPDTGQPVVFQVNLDQAPFPSTMADINAAFAAWNNVPGSSLRLANGGASGVCNPDYQINSIIFNNCDARFSPSPCAGTLAVGGLSWRQETRVVNGVTFYRAARGFVSFNPYARCYYTDTCRLQEIATHEMGHAIGLGHSQYGDATMAAYAHFDGRCATLREDDQNGVVFIYPSSSGGGGPLTITTTSPLPAGTTGNLYGEPLAASGGTFPYTWGLASGSLPPGLRLRTDGVIAGIPNATGTHNFTAQVTDAAQGTAQKSFAITINSSPYAAQFVSQNVPSQVTAGQRFEFNLKWNNTGSDAWSETSGVRIGSQNPPHNNTWGGNRVVLPGGLTVAPGQQLDITVAAVAPTTPGAYNFQWQMIKEGGPFFGEMSPNLSITVASPNTVILNGPATLQAVKGTAFGQQYNASGGTPPYTWSIISGALPSGLVLNAGSGLISGTPTVLGNFAVTIQAADSQARNAQQPVTITVSPAPLAIENTSLPQATKEQAFSFQMTASGGVQPYTWSISSGALPAGIALNSATGMLSGTPTATGTSGFTVQVTDSQARAAQKQISLTVMPPPLVIVTASTPPAIKGAAFTLQMSATGGTPPYTWSITAGTLPAGLLLHAESGILSGTPTQSGLFNFTVTVKDQGAFSNARAYQLQVVEPESVPRITSVKYKKGSRKLIVKGANFDANATLLIDGGPVGANFQATKATSKGLVLTPGTHEVRVVNANGVASLGVIVSVN